MNKLIYVCTPYRASTSEELAENIRLAKRVCKRVLSENDVPYAPHLFFPGFLDEDNPNERMNGIEMGLELMDACDEVYLFGFNITEGMKFELDHARAKRIPVCLYDENMSRVNIRTLPIDERATADYRRTIKGLRLVK